ncbi:hypothetical protein HA402_006878 [Bradysia odoriphaga]|nr:hypothetical protein HA402_006878 [Bradysia odoriphaga]
MDQSSNTQLSGDDLNLKRLESLSIETFDNDIFDLSIRLPVGILTELRISSLEWNKLTALLNRQLNIKKLKLTLLTDKAIVTDIFDKLQLESLELDALKMSSKMIATILSKLPILKSLILSEIVVNERVMNNVGDLSELETLTIDVTNIPVTSFENIRKLKRLKDLELQFSDRQSTSGAEILKTLAQSDNASLVKLSLVGFSYSTYDIISTKSVDHIAALAKSAPHLKKFKIIRTCFL